jgi:hypothetical protein
LHPLQFNLHDPFRRPGVFVRLKELQEGLSAPGLFGACRKQLAAEAEFLRCATVPKVEERWLEEAGIDALHVPATIEVIGKILPRDEAAVQVQGWTAGMPKDLGDGAEAAEELATVRRCAEAGLDLHKRRDVNARRQESRLIEFWDHGSTQL